MSSETKLEKCLWVPVYRHYPSDLRIKKPPRLTLSMLRDNYCFDVEESCIDSDEKPIISLTKSSIVDLTLEQLREILVRASVLSRSSARTVIAISKRHPRAPSLHVLASSRRPCCSYSLCELTELMRFSKFTSVIHRRGAKEIYFARSLLILDN